MVVDVIATIHITSQLPHLFRRHFAPRGCEGGVSFRSKFPTMALESTADAGETPPAVDVHRLDGEAFPSFASLLEACDDYAGHSGCRFILQHFVGILDDMTEQDPGALRVAGSARSSDSGPLLAAKLAAAPETRRVAGLLRDGDSSLVKEVNLANQVIAEESLHNAMSATFKALDLWPPSPPSGVSRDDCAYRDFTAPLPVIAQRTYNEKARRLADMVGSKERAQRIGQTASFILDFAKETCDLAPTPLQEEQRLLERFTDMVAAYQNPEAPVTDAEHVPKMDTLGAGRKWWEENRETVVWAAAGAAALVAASAVAASRPGRRRR